MESSIYPRWMYRKGDGVAALFDTKEHFEGMRDKHLWQETPWRKPEKGSFCLECENLKGQIKTLESEIEVRSELLSEDGEKIKKLESDAVEREKRITDLKLGLTEKDNIIEAFKVATKVEKSRK